MLILFSKLAIKLDEPDSISVSSDLMTKIGNYRDKKAHPVYMLAEKLARRFRELPED